MCAVSDSVFIKQDQTLLVRIDTPDYAGFGNIRAAFLFFIRKIVGERKKRAVFGVYF